MKRTRATTSAPKASYSSIDGADQSAEAVTPRVGDPPLANAGPVFPDAEDGHKEVREDASSGTSIGNPVAATDLNGDSLT